MGTSPQSTTITTVTDATGSASATIAQTGPASGMNTITIQVKNQGTVIFQKTVTKTWVAPQISITKTGPATVGIGTNANYAITVKNTGTIPDNSTVLTDTIPTGMGYVSSTPAGTVSGSTVTWNLGTLAPGATAPAVTLVLKGNTPGTWTDTAVVKSVEGATAQASATTVVTPVVALLNTLTDSVDPVAVGNRTVYTFTITNQGQYPVNGLQVAIIIPIANEAYVSSTGPTGAGTYTAATGTITYATVPTINAGQAMPFTVTVTAIAPGTVICRGTFTATNYPQTVTTQEGTTIY
jgi:uncharacterized repeat protein (TIGR01451 family)